MYEFNKEDIRTFRSTDLVNNITPIYVKNLTNTKCLGFHHVDKTIKGFIERNNIREIAKDLIEKYPMSYFAYAASSEHSARKNSMIIKSMEHDIMKVYKKVVKIKNQLKEYKNSTDSKNEGYNQVILAYNDCIRTLEDITDDLQQKVIKIKNLGTVEDIATRERFMLQSHTIDDPAWWTWPHCCVEMALYVIPNIIRATYPEMRLYVCSSPVHTFLTNTDNKDTIRELCFSGTFGRDVKNPLIFDLIQQVNYNAGREEKDLYQGTLVIESFEEAIISFAENKKVSTSRLYYARMLDLQV